ncbi:MAG: hypothetical protein WCI04_05795, partial [archaeon]
VMNACVAAGGCIKVYDYCEGYPVCSGITNSTECLVADAVCHWDMLFERCIIYELYGCEDVGSAQVCKDAGCTQKFKCTGTPTTCSNFNSYPNSCKLVGCTWS